MKRVWQAMVSTWRGAEGLPPMRVASTRLGIPDQRARLVLGGAMSVLLGLSIYPVGWLVLSVLQASWAHPDPTWWLIARVAIAALITGVYVLGFSGVWWLAALHARWWRSTPACARCRYGLVGVAVELGDGEEEQVVCPECGERQAAHHGDVGPAPDGDDPGPATLRRVAHFRYMTALGRRWLDARRRLLWRTGLVATGVALATVMLVGTPLSIRVVLGLLDASVARADVRALCAAPQPVPQHLSGVLAAMRQAADQAGPVGADYVMDLWAGLPESWTLSLWADHRGQPAGLPARLRSLRARLDQPAIARLVHSIEHGAPPAPVSIDLSPPVLRPYVYDLRISSRGPEEGAVPWLVAGLQVGIIEALVRVHEGRWMEAGQLLIATDRVGREVIQCVPLAGVNAVGRQQEFIIDAVARLLVERPPAAFLDAISASVMFDGPWVSVTQQRRSLQAGGMLGWAVVFADPLNHVLAPWYDPGRLVPLPVRRVPPPTVPEWLSRVALLPVGRYDRRPGEVQAAIREPLPDGHCATAMRFDARWLLVSPVDSAWSADQPAPHTTPALGVRLAIAALQYERMYRRSPTTAADVMQSAVWTGPALPADVSRALLLTPFKIMTPTGSVRWFEIRLGPTLMPSDDLFDDPVFPPASIHTTMQGLTNFPTWAEWMAVELGR
jgi:hypothetical protein